MDVVSLQLPTEEGGDGIPGQNPPQKKAKWQETGETKGDQFLTFLIEHLDPAVPKATYHYVSQSILSFAYATVPFLNPWC